MTLDTDFTIVERYGAEYRGYVQYYLLAQNVYRLGRLRRVMEVSMLKTLALKHKSTVSAMARRYKASTTTPDGPRACFQVSVEREGRKPLVARFGGIPLKRRRTVSEINDRKFPTRMRGNELIHRLLAGQCEMCASRTGLQVHRRANLPTSGNPDKPSPPSGRRRWHPGDARPWWSASAATTISTPDGPRLPPGSRALESRMNAACPVRGRGRRKRTPTTGTSPAADFTVVVSDEEKAPVMASGGDREGERE